MGNICYLIFLTKPSLIAFDCIFLTQKNAGTTLEYENEPSPEVFQEVQICSCVKVVVRITDDIPLLNWIHHSSFRNEILEQN